MKGVCIKFYAYEFEKHRGRLLFEWLLDWAKELEVHGGTVVKSIAGFGRSGKVKEESFLELASNVPVEVSFVMETEKQKLFFEKIKQENLTLFYTVTQVEYGYLGS